MSQIARQLRDNLDDVDLWEVYGDELQEQGDPRGEMIAWSVSLARTPSGATAAAIRKWLVAHSTWAIPISQERIEAVREPVKRHNVARVDLSMGHARHVELAIQGSDDAVRTWWTERLTQAVADPLLQFLPSAHVHVLYEGAAAVAFHTVRWPLRSLTVWADDCPLPSPAALATACPELERLSIDGWVESTTALAHPQLQRIAWTLGHIHDEPDDEALAWLLQATLPKLTELIVDRRLSSELQEALTARFGAIVVAVAGRDRTRYIAHPATP